MELLSVGALGFCEQLADQMLKHIERLVGQGRGKFQYLSREGGVAAQRLQLRQVLHGALSTLAGEFEPIVLVNARGALRLDAQGPNQVQSLDQLGEITARCRVGGLPVARQSG